jgi:hypothetical protein
MQPPFSGTERGGKYVETGRVVKEGEKRRPGVGSFERDALWFYDIGFRGVKIVV